MEENIGSLEKFTAFCHAADVYTVSNDLKTASFGEGENSILHRFIDEQPFALAAIKISRQSSASDRHRMVELFS